MQQVQLSLELIESKSNKSLADVLTCMNENNPPLQVRQGCLNENCMWVPPYNATNKEMAAHHSSFQKFFSGVFQCDTTGHQQALPGKGHPTHRAKMPICIPLSLGIWSGLPHPLIMPRAVSLLAHPLP